MTTPKILLPMIIGMFAATVFVAPAQACWMSAFDEIDKDGDGYISRQEAMEHMNEGFARRDINSDTLISRQEFNLYMDKRKGLRINNDADKKIMRPALKK